MPDQGHQMETYVDPLSQGFWWSNGGIKAPQNVRLIFLGLYDQALLQHKKNIKQSFWVINRHHYQNPV